MSDDADLIRRFVGIMERLDDSLFTHDSPPPKELAVGVDPNDWNRILWRPAELSTSASALSSIRSVFGELPQLYEQLALSYRWVEVDLTVCRLLANPPGEDLSQLLNELLADSVMNNTLVPARFCRFALAPNECYDQICFDLNRYRNGDCPIVRFNHEAILMHDSLGEAELLFGSFRDMMLAIVALVD